MTKSSPEAFGSKWVAALIAGAAVALSASCDALQTSGLLAVLGDGVHVVIENKTTYTAVLDLRTSKSKNLGQDFIEESEQVTQFGVNGALAPGQTASVRLSCNSDLELLWLAGVEFRAGGLSVGDMSLSEKLRRDREFDCGDTVRIAISGTIFNFDADVEVEHSDQASSNSDNDDSQAEDVSNDIGNLLDDLFD